MLPARRLTSRRAVVDQARTSPPAPEQQPAGWRAIPVRAPAARPTLPSPRGPAALVTVLDFMERATARATSLGQLLVVFTCYGMFLLVLPVAGAAYVAGRLLGVASWPGMASVGLLATAGGSALFVRRWQQNVPAGPAPGGAPAETNPAAGAPTGINAAIAGINPAAGAPAEINPGQEMRLSEATAAGDPVAGDPEGRVSGDG
ncbi:hypothetical protein AB0M02_23755 [Actinoplanes sp. NPDC051861]|uniref:hypothetical protein n=1 Tax=Actinoplanes sp. NPDC051861 TaxID=3155170 RepID=UPI003426FF4A